MARHRAVLLNHPQLPADTLHRIRLLMVGASPYYTINTASTRFEGFDDEPMVTEQVSLAVQERLDDEGTHGRGRDEAGDRLGDVDSDVEEEPFTQGCEAEAAGVGSNEAGMGMAKMSLIPAIYSFFIMICISGDEEESEFDDAEVILDSFAHRGSALEQEDYEEHQEDVSQPAEDLEHLAGRQPQGQPGQPMDHGEPPPGHPIDEEDADDVFNDDGFEMPIDIGEQGKQWICGWLAYKFRLKYPSLENIGALGYPTDQVPPDFGPIPPWIAIQSRGGICTHTPNFSMLIQKWDLIFASMMGSEISYEPLVIKTLFNNIVRHYPSIPEEIIHKYSRFRCFSRKRFLSLQLQDVKRKENLRKAERNAKRKAEEAAKAVLEEEEEGGPSQVSLMGETALRRNRRKLEQNSGRK